MTNDDEEGHDNKSHVNNLNTDGTSVDAAASNMVARSEGKSPGTSQKRAGSPSQTPPRQRSSPPTM